MRLARPAPASALLALVLVVPTAVVAPTFVVSTPTPHPVAAQVQTLDLGGVDAASLAQSAPPVTLARTWSRVPGRSDAEAARAAERPPVVLTEPLGTDGYRMLGVTWKGAAPTAESAVLVTARTRSAGAWSEWFELHTMVDGGTEPSPNGRYGTVPYWAGDSDGLQVRVDAIGSARPTDVRADLIEPGTSDADAAITGDWNGSTAAASTDRPPIVTRAEWGADESLRDKRLENSDTFKVAFVHHTAGSNSYTRAESPAVVRGLYSYYVRTLKYADMGYNFLVDKYGTIYEGRAGSITKPVRSAASGGFNTDTLAVVAMGNFETASASDAMVRGIAKVLAYRLSRYHRDPYGTKVLTAEVGSSKYEAGRKVSFDVISGHRDSQLTACPGGNLYRRLGTIRDLTADYMGSSLIEPTISTRSVPMGADVDVDVKARVTQQQSWSLTVREWCSGTLVRRITGNASRQSPIRVSWGGRDDAGNRVAAGRYRVTLTSSGDGTSAWPFESQVTVGAGGDAGAPTTSSLAAAASGSYVTQPPQTLLSSTTGVGTRDRMLLGADRRLDVQVLGRAGVPSSGVSAVALQVEAACAGAPTRVSVSPDSVSGLGTPVVSVGRNGTARGFTLVRVGPEGGVRFHSSGGAVGVRASVVGYVSTSGSGGSLVPLRRSALGAATPVSLGSAPTTVEVAGRAGVPADARAVVLAVRRSGTSPVGAVWAWPAGADQPGQPSWRRPQGSGVVSQLIVPIGDGGAVRVAGDRAGTVSLDVAGYVAARRDRAVRPLVPKALLGDGVRLDAGESRTVDVRGRMRVPADATAVVVQISGTAPRNGGRLMVWPRGSDEPATADLIVPREGARETVAVLRLGDGGDLRVRARDATVRANLTVLGWID